MSSEFLSFKLSDDFVKAYEKREVNWGFPIHDGLSLGELTYISKYSRIKDDGTKERWHETCRRVIEGMFSIQKDWCKNQRTPWNDHKAQRAAKDAYERMFVFKWTPPGRGMWAMGTDMVHGHNNSAALYNCAFLTTAKLSSHSKYEAVWPFSRLMEMSMWGIGVGFDTKGAGNITLHKPEGEAEVYVVEDTREAWADSVGRMLVSFFLPNQRPVVFDYSKIRPAGSPLKTFGGRASGPDPLIELHTIVKELLTHDEGKQLSSRNIVDIMNLIGKAVVAGGARRSAELSLGDIDDIDYINLKNWELPENGRRTGGDGWAWMSNNSVFVNVDTDLTNIIESVKVNGEPGIVWYDTMREYGRIADPKDYKDMKAAGVNPCAEITLEGGGELCCVSGDTRIQTKTGAPHIEDVVGQQVEVWNGDSWSKVTPFLAAHNKALYRVTLSDGSQLDVTDNHEWLVKRSTERTFKKLSTIELEPGMDLPSFALEIESIGKRFEHAYQWGFFAGDGFMDRGQALALVQEPEAEVLLPALAGAERAWQHPEGYSRPFTRVNVSEYISSEEGTQLRDSNDGLPDVAFQWDADSVADFMAGWIDADGSVRRNPKSQHLILHGSEKKLRDAQILLRRCGVNGASVHLEAPMGAVTNKGERTKDLYALRIPAHECSMIPTKLKVVENRPDVGFMKNNAHPDGRPTSLARKQKVVSVELVDVGRDTFCFTELVKHMGVFGNALTFQCLAETYINNHEDLDDYKATCKVAMLYAKTVTLMPTPWPETNEIMVRNRRIGVSMTGTAQFADDRGWHELRTWQDAGYHYICEKDDLYSEWLGVRTSIRKTTSKPAGSTSLLAGCAPGVHWPTSAGTFLRRMRFSVMDPIVDVIKEAGYRVEPDQGDPRSTVVAEFPVEGLQMRSEREVSVWEKAELAAFTSRWWADNAVSVTVTFKSDEAEQIAPILRSKAGQFKTISFLPLTDEGVSYAQAPFGNLTEKEAGKIRKKLKKVDLLSVYRGGEAADAAGEKFCTTDACELKIG